MSNPNNGGTCFDCSSCHNKCPCCNESLTNGVCEFEITKVGNVSKSNVYTIKQTRELYDYYKDEDENWHALPRRYGNFFNNDNEIAYKTLDGIGAWRC